MLLNSHSLDAAKFASKSKERPILASLCITPTHVVATDSYHLIEVKHIKQDDQPKLEGIRNDSGTGLVPAEAALHACKNIPKGDTLFALKHAFTSLDADGKRITLTTTDLMQQKSVEANLTDGVYPPYKTIFPTEPAKGCLCVNAEYLRDVADYFAKHGEGNKVLIEFRGMDKPMVFLGETDGVHQQVRALVMPIRMSDEEVAKYAS